MSDSAGAFTLQDPQFSEADVSPTRWLTFASSALEQDFVRFRGRGRDVITVLLIVVAPLVSGVKLFLTPQTSLTAIFLLVGIGFGFLAIPAFVIGVVCARRPAEDSAARQLVLALRQERFLLLQISTTLMPGLGEWLVRYRECRDDATRHNVCETAFTGVPMAVIAAFHLAANPFLLPLIAADATVIAVTLVMMAVFSGNTSALDYVVVAMLLVTTALVFMCDSYVRERAERRSFVEHATVIKAKLEMERLSENTRAVVAAAMPHELIQLGIAAPTHHRSDDASVGISDIADFASWSCGLLIREVVAALHDLMMLVDVGASLHDVVNVMSYGDSSVVCAGLLTTCLNHAERVTKFGRWMLHSPDTLSFRVRFSMSSGCVMGGLVGDTCKRYIIAGSAVTAAKLALAAAAPGTMVTASDDGATGSVAHPTERSNVDENSGATVPSICEAPTFSHLLLSFNDDESQARLHMFEARNFEESKKLLAFVPAAIFVAHLAALLLELAGEDERRRTRGPYPFTGVAAAIALTAIVAALRRCNATPHALDVALTATAFLVATIATELSNSAMVNGMRLLIVLGCPNLFPRLPWVAQAAVLLVTVGVPTLVLQYVLGGDAAFVANWFITIVLIAVMKYVSKRVACQQYVAEATAQLAVTAARDDTQRFDRLLAGLLPPHAVCLLTDLKLRVEGNKRVRKKWEDVSVLQVQLSVGLLRDVVPLAAAWSSVASAVTTTPGPLLELVETCGDCFLIGGPFGGSSTCDDRKETANEVLRLISTLKKLTTPHCPFTAVATHGSAYSALVGNSGLTFCFFGPAIRESNAILAAAPNTAGAVAFASAAFRQQHANFGVPARPPRDDAKAQRGLAMSLAVAAESTQRSTHAAADAATKQFGPAMNWRIRGVGVARVSVVTIEQ
jgi:hypothetical protein